MKNINTRGFANMAVVVIGLLLVGLGSYVMLQKRANAPTTTTVVNTSDWKTYKSEKYGFEFKYPKEWTLNTDYSDYYKEFSVGVTDPKYPGKYDTDAPATHFGVYVRGDLANTKQCLKEITDWDSGLGGELKSRCFKDHSNILISMSSAGGDGKIIDDMIFSTFKFTK